MRSGGLTGAARGRPTRKRRPPAATPRFRTKPPALSPRPVRHYARCPAPRRRRTRRGPADLGAAPDEARSLGEEFGASGEGLGDVALGQPPPGRRCTCSAPTAGPAAPARRASARAAGARPSRQHRRRRRRGRRTRRVRPISRAGFARTGDPPGALGLPPPHFLVGQRPLVITRVIPDQGRVDQRDPPHRLPHRGRGRHARVLAVPRHPAPREAEPGVLALRGERRPARPPLDATRGGR